MRACFFNSYIFILMCNLIYVCVYKWVLHVYDITTAAISPNSCKNVNFILVIQVKKVSHRLTSSFISKFCQFYLFTLQCTLFLHLHSHVLIQDLIISHLISCNTLLIGISLQIHPHANAAFTLCQFSF